MDNLRRPVETFFAPAERASDEQLREDIAFATHNPIINMKLFGENLLGGTVGFTSSQSKGTVFRLSLPMSRF